MLLPKYFNNEKILVAITGISEGNMSFSIGDSEIAKENVLEVLEKLQIRNSKFSIRNIEIEHSDRIIEIDKLDIAGNIQNEFFSCDALFTNQRNQILVLKPADCTPLIITDTNNTLIGLIHLGWKSTDLSLAAKAIEFALNTYDIKASDIKCLIGPSIRQSSYKYKGFTPPHPEIWKSFMKLDTDGFELIDNIGAIKKQLILSGVPSSNITDLEIDTYSNKDYFSHARDFHQGLIDSGRNGVFVMLR